MVKSLYEPIGVRVGRNLRDLRTAKGLTQATLSELSGVGMANISRIERGANPTIDVLEALSAALDCDLERIVRKRPD